MNLQEALQTNNYSTANEMATHSSSLSHVLNLFYHIGGLRKSSEDRSVQEIIHGNFVKESEDKCQLLIDLFTKAISEDAERAIKIMFWARDIRNGAGERQIFKDLIYYLSYSKYNKILEKNIELIPHYGRWDDLLILVDTPLEEKAFSLIQEAIIAAIVMESHIQANNMEDFEKDHAKNLVLKGMNCAKWMPRKGKIAAKLRNYMEFSPKQYRKILVSLTNVVEQKMCGNKWSEIDFSKLPSLASARYQKAFDRWQTNRYKKYLKRLQKGEDKINANVVYPYDVVKSLKNGNETTKQVAEEQWKSLPNLMKDCDELILPIVDTSGSMTQILNKSKELSVLDVAVSLGLYISERNNGPFKDSFITFSQQPELQVVKGSLQDRLIQMERANWTFNTDIEAVFDLILEQADKNNISENDMPDKILILSDMEFDQAVLSNSTNPNILDLIKEKYSQRGYKLPQLVFWNLNSTNKGIPVQKHKTGVTMVSGFSPSILKSILNIKELTPINIMDSTIMNERYKPIKI